MSTISPSDELVFQHAERHVRDACEYAEHLPPYLAALKLYAIPALELAGYENWRMTVAKGAAEIALTEAEELVAALRKVVEAIDTAAAVALEAAAP